MLRCHAAAEVRLSQSCARPSPPRTRRHACGVMCVQVTCFGRADGQHHSVVKLTSPSSGALECLEAFAVVVTPRLVVSTPKVVVEGGECHGLVWQEVAGGVQHSVPVCWWRVMPLLLCWGLLMAGSESLVSLVVWCTHKPCPLRAQEGSPWCGAHTSPAPLCAKEGSPWCGAHTSPASLRAKEGSPWCGAHTSPAPLCAKEGSPWCGAHTSPAPLCAKEGSPWCGAHTSPAPL